MPTMERPIPGGLLVAIEGIDGAGKTTLANGLRRLLESTGVPVVQGKEPTAGPWGMKLRESAAAGRLSPEDELRYLLLDRRQHVDEVIRPALASGAVMLLDRYFPSTVAYQGAAGLQVEDLLSANDFAPTPDVLLLLDLEPTVGLARIRARGDVPNHFETPETLAMCREIFLALDMRKHVINAHSTVDEVLSQAHLAVLLAITERMRDRHGPTPEAAEAMIPFLAGHI